MLCFRDRAYCNAYPTKCVNDQCSRAVTAYVEANAKIARLPIAYSDLSRGEGCEGRIAPTVKP